MSLKHLVKALALTPSTRKSESGIPQPVTPAYDVRMANDRHYLVLAVPLTRTSYVDSRSGSSVIVAKLDIPSFVTRIHDQTVQIGVSRGRVWLKPVRTGDFPF